MLVYILKAYCLCNFKHQGLTKKPQNFRFRNVRSNPRDEPVHFL